MIERLTSLASLLLDGESLMRAALAVLGFACMLLMFQKMSLEEDLLIEREAHLRTQGNLMVALAACELSDITNTGLRTLAEACMEREAQGQVALAERSAIMAKAKPRPQRVEEQKEVVDDVTRQVAADRLNRPF